jgi:hypothetical protein
MSRAAEHRQKLPANPPYDAILDTIVSSKNIKGEIGLLSGGIS